MIDWLILIDINPSRFIMKHVDADKTQREKKIDANYTRRIWAILNKSWKQHPTKQQLYSLLPPILKTIQVRRTRHAWHCRRSKDEISLHLYRGYDTKQSDDEAPVILELWGMWNTPWLPSLPGKSWPRVVAPKRVRYMGQIELFDHLNCM